uniref:Uncharacterized protein n=1 Tax=viral metagenome TaxID=1070528 RepID=A0A6M3M9V7_9ZZZZ
MRKYPNPKNLTTEEILKSRRPFHIDDLVALALEREDVLLASHCLEELKQCDDVKESVVDLKNMIFG